MASFRERTVIGNSLYTGRLRGRLNLIPDKRVDSLNKDIKNVSYIDFL